MLVGARIAVIGGTSGIGRAIASACGQAGAQVVVASRSKDRVAEAAGALGPSARGLPVDITDDASVAAFAGAAGPLDHVVVTAHAAASLATLVAIEALDFAAVRSVIEVKVLGTLRVVRALVPHLAARGSVLLVSGAAGRRVLPGHVVLGAVNAAIEGMARQLARELAPRRVNVVCPGLTRSEAYAGLPEGAREAMYAKAAATLPVGRVGEPEDIAQAALALLGNPFCTGAVLDCDGGGILVGPPKA